MKQLSYTNYSSLFGERDVLINSLSTMYLLNDFVEIDDNTTYEDIIAHIESTNSDRMRYYKLAKYGNEWQLQTGIFFWR